MKANKVSSILAIILLFAVVFAISALPGIAQKTKPVDQQNPDMALHLVNKATGKPLRNMAVVVHTDNGIRCIKAPCPTNWMTWKGTTDDKGNVVIPGRIIQMLMTLSIPGFRNGIDLQKEPKEDDHGRRVLYITRDTGQG